MAVHIRTRARRIGDARTNPRSHFQSAHGLRDNFSGGDISRIFQRIINGGDSIMTGNAFERRESALEDEFFYRVDQELIAQLKAEQQHESELESLQETTGIGDRHVLEELRTAQITSRTLAAFSMFPAVYVAWADGHVERAEREAVLKAARHQGIFSVSPAYDLLESWLCMKPHAELLEAWKDFIHALRPTVSDLTFREMKHVALERAESVARAAGGFLGLATVSKAEKAALAELHAVFDDAIATAGSVRTVS